MCFRSRQPPRAAASWMALGASVLVGACAVQRPVVPPDAGVAVPARWAAAVPAQQSEAGVAWWDSFQDALLSRLVADAMRHNTRVRGAEANLREARALRAQARAGLYPTAAAGLAGQVSAGRGQSSPLFDASLDASWEADLFGGTRHGVAAQDVLVRSSAATLESVRVSIAAEVALAYLDLRNAQARAQIARENLAAQEETLQIARWREQAGLASSLEVEQSRTSVEQTRAQLPLLQASATTSAHAIAVLTGEVPQARLAELAPAAQLPQPSPAAVAPPALALARRPDVVAAEARLHAAAEQVAQADANRYPGLALRASAQWSGLSLGSLGAVSAARAIVASLAAPVFDAGLRNAQLQASQARFEAAQQDWRAAVLTALQDVENALVSLQATRERLAALRAALDAARSASTLASHRYASGVIDFLTVLETQRTLLNVQDGVAAAQAELAAAQVRLFKAAGGGWTPAGLENPS